MAVPTGTHEWAISSPLERRSLQPVAWFVDFERELNRLAVRSVTELAALAVAARFPLSLEKKEALLGF